MRKLARTAAAFLMTASVGAALSRPAHAAAASGRPEACGGEVQIECVNVQASTPSTDQQPPLVGLLNAGSTPANAAAARGLRPDFWRIGFGNMLWDAKQAGAPIEFLLSDGWNFGPGAANPPWWDDAAPDWTVYDQYVLSTVRSVAASPTPPAWWDISNEEHRGTVDLRVEMFIRAEQLIRSILPNAKIVGMSQSSYDETQFRALLSAVSRKNAARQAAHQPPIVFDAVSWHEMGRPADVINHVAQFRQLLSQFNLHGMPQPAIQINEYLGPQDVNRPAAVVSWLHALQVSGVTRAAHACWSDAACNVSLDGLLDDTTLIPRPEYWVYWDYARMHGRRLRSHTYGPDQQVQLTSVATENRAAGTMRILIGQYGTRTPGGGRVRIAVTGYHLRKPGHRVKVQVERISATAPNSSTPPPVTSTRMVTVSASHSFEINLRGYVPGDAYLLTIGG